ncbi:MAG: hypothetical protein K2L99_01740, partial [Muribaculaceae bacterium]|nr:hypothetical protein [Muribaculaceae bacterium]
MKKFLLSLAMVLGISAAASAAEVTIEGSKFTAGDNNVEATVSGYTVLVDKAEGATKPALNVYNDVTTVRAYANNTITVSGEKVTKVVFTINTATNSKRYCKIEASTGTVSAQAAGDETVTWTGDATEVTFTVEATASLGTEDTKPGQFHFLSVTVDGEAGATPDAPTPDDPTPDDPVEGDVTISYTDFAKNEDNGNQEASKDGFTVVAAKADGSSVPAVLPAANPTALRVYAKSTVTVSGEKLTKIVFKLADTQAARYTTFTPNTGAVATQAAGDTEITWTGDAASVTFTVGELATLGTESTKNGQIHIASIIITGEGGEGGDTPVTPPTPTGKEYTVINTMVAGDYVIAAGEHAMDQLPESKNYGYPGVVAATFADDVLTTAAPVFTFVTATGGYYIKCADGRYLYQTGNYNSFNVSETPSDEGIFTVTLAADGTATITNTNVNKTLAFDSNFNSFGSYPEVGDRELPKLYIGKGTGIAEIATEDAPVEYFNLQGVRINEPAAGQVVIRRQGNKVSKL